MWEKLATQLIPAHCIVEGLPVVCQQHPQERRVLKTPADFASHAEDGGCERKCGHVLPCGHLCPLRCHALGDNVHDRIKCKEPKYETCPAGKHTKHLECHEKVPYCTDCEKEERLRKRHAAAEAKLTRARREKEERLRQQELEAQAAYHEQLVELESNQEEHELQRHRLQLKQEMDARLRVLRQERERALAWA